MNTLISILLNIINNTLTDNTTREIARQILRMYPVIDNVKASEIAEKSFCNTSTVNRFCKSLGFKSFMDLKSYIMVSHGVRQAQLLHHMEVCDPQKMLDNIRILSSGDFDEKEFIETCRKINKIIYKAPSAICVGAVYPEALMFHYMEDMIEMGKCIYNSPVSRELTVPTEPDNTAVIMISFTGRLFRYCSSEFNEICSKYKDIIVMTADEEFLAKKPEGAFRLPFSGDDEVNNAAFIEMMRYLKYDYFVSYYAEK